MHVQLGKYNQLPVVKEVDFGVYLDGDDDGEILLPAQKKPDADWQSFDRLAKENGDFHEFIELVSVYFQTGTLREKDWDNKTA